MNIKLTGVILFGHDIGSLKKFYEENFGFIVLEEIPNEWVLLQAGDAQLGLHRVGPAHDQGNEPFRVESNSKLVFEIKNDLEVFRNSLIQKGVSMREIKVFPAMSYRVCDGQDFEGNIFQLKEQII